MGSQDEEFSQVFVSTSTGTSELLLAGGVLARNHPQPGSKSPALLEGCPLADGRDGGRGLRPLRIVMPRSSSNPRIWLITAVRPPPTVRGFGAATADRADRQS
jgi:hypothetical protein